MPTQKEMADVWLRKHGVGGAADAVLAHGPLLAPEDADACRRDEADADDWARDAERWYEQRALGVDVAQLLRLQQSAAK